VSSERESAGVGARRRCSARSSSSGIEKAAIKRPVRKPERREMKIIPDERYIRQNGITPLKRPQVLSDTAEPRRVERLVRFVRNVTMPAGLLF